MAAGAAAMNQVHAEMMWDMGYRTVSILHDTTDYGRGHLLWESGEAAFGGWSDDQLPAGHLSR